MKSQNWKPLVYISTTVGAVAIVLTLAYAIAKLLIPGFTFVAIRRAEGRILIGIAGAMAYGTVVATNKILKWFWGREFGTYLDDPDSETTELRSTGTTRCRRCGSPFQAYANDAHTAGFCSQACRSRGA